MKTIYLLKILIITLIFTLTSVNAISQSIEQQRDSLLKEVARTKIDSNKVKLYEQLFDLYEFSDVKQALIYAKKSLKLSQKANYYNGKRTAYLNLFNYHFHKGSHSDSLLVYLKQMEKTIVEAADSANLYYVHGCYGLYYSRTQELEKKLKSNLESLRVLKKFNDKPAVEGHLYHNIASTFSDLDKNEECLRYLKKAYPLKSGASGKGFTLLDMGNIHYLVYNNIDTVQVFYEEAMKLFEQDNNLFGIVKVMQRKAFYYQNKQQFERAENTLLNALSIIKKNEFGSLLVMIYIDLCDFYYDTKNYYNAIKYGELALETVKTQNAHKFENETLERLHRSYAITKQYDKAYEILNVLKIQQDSLNNAAYDDKVKELTTQYEVAEKESENNLLKLNLQSRKRTSIILIIALLFAVAFAISVVRSNLQRKKLNQILEQKVAERTKDLEQANYELRTFNYIASHDIKEPIRVIGGYAGLIFRKLPADLKENLGEYFDTIKRSTSQLYTLIEDFARYTTLSKDEVIEKQDVDLNFLVFNVIDNLQETIKKKKGMVEISDLPTIKTGNSLLFTTLKNLIENGLKYNKSETPAVEVSYESTERHHQIIVSDNGIGIDKQYHEKIFEMFKRLHNRGAYEGSGIGLAIVKLSVEKLGGTISLESEEGKGSRFVIELPQ